MITNGNNGFKINSVNNTVTFSVTDSLADCFHGYNAVNVTAKKMCPVTIIRMIRGYIGSNSLMPAN